ncbi:carbon storage regulator CsrA [bacterium 3DAC]|nr:carbon storage regulator CsrA [bacterium 3DAC]
MLVLTRKKGEAIVIGDNIKIVVVSVSGDSVKIGIEAPADVKILRAELLEAVKDINVVAAKTMPHVKVKKGGEKPSILTDLTIKAKRKDT